MAEKTDWLNMYLDKRVVVDLDTRHVVIGDLLDYSAEHLILGAVDLHDCESANSTKEVYLVEAGQYGVNVNRKKVGIPRSKMFAISLLKEAELG